MYRKPSLKGWRSNWRALAVLTGKSLKQRWLAQVTGSGKMLGDAFLYLSEPTLPMNQ